LGKLRSLSQLMPIFIKNKRNEAENRGDNS